MIGKRISFSIHKNTSTREGVVRDKVRVPKSEYEGHTCIPDTPIDVYLVETNDRHLILVPPSAIDKIVYPAHYVN